MEATDLTEGVWRSAGWDRVAAGGRGSYRQGVSTRARMRFIISGSVGLAFFLLPVPWQGRLTVPFDIAVRWITEGVPGILAVYCLARGINAM